jgi:uncharacterized membrane protein YoaK (UPF0700 family)
MFVAPSRNIGIAHMTGNISKFAIDFGIQGDESFEFNDMHGRFATAVSSYIFGSMICGLIVQPGNTLFQMGNQHFFALLLEIILLFASYLLFKLEQFLISAFVAAAACGLQNAIGTIFSGAILRTTHMTGICTDIGTIIGHRIRFGENAKDTWKLKVFIPLVFGFVCGAVFGYDLTRRIGAETMLVPIFLTGMICFVYLSVKIYGFLGERYYSNNNKAIADSSDDAHSKSGLEIALLDRSI